MRASCTHLRRSPPTSVSCAAPSPPTPIRGAPRLDRHFGRARRLRAGAILEEAGRPPGPLQGPPAQAISFVFLRHAPRLASVCLATGLAMAPAARPSARLCGAPRALRCAGARGARGAGKGHGGNAAVFLRWPLSKHYAAHAVPVESARPDKNPRGVACQQPIRTRGPLAANNGGRKTM